jgi:hypothetical protein
MKRELHRKCENKKKEKNLRKEESGIGHMMENIEGII